MFHIFSESILYTDDSYNYYKVPVADGTRLFDGAVADTCQAVGLEAVCAGPANCEYSSDRCIVTTLSTDCGSPMRPISIEICDTTYAPNCPELQGLFSYMHNYPGECGIVGDSWCADGANYVSGDPVYFAYCAAAI